jgi:carboxymethylenebutenolidase
MIELEVGDAKVAAYEATAERESPGVALYHAWWGLNDDIRAFADRLAGAGFHVLAPDMFAGQVATEIENADRLSSSSVDDWVEQVVLAATDKLAERTDAPSSIGAVGFSFGAAWAIWAATKRPQVAATVVYYGTWVDDVLAQATTPVLGNFAEDDPYEDAETVDAFEQRLRDAGRKVVIHRYPRTGHWFAEPSRNVYQAEAADLAFERTVEFLRRHIGD